MSWLQLVLNFVANIAWPAVAVVVVVVLRREFSALLARVTKISTPLGSLDAQAREIANDAERLDVRAMRDDTKEMPADLQEREMADGDPSLTQDRTEEEVSALWRSATDFGAQDVPDEVEDLFAPAMRLVKIDPSESVRMAWRAFSLNVWRLEYGNQTRFFGQGVSPLSDLARLGLSTEFLALVKQLEELWRSRANLSAAGATYYVEAAVRLAALVWFHCQDVGEPTDVG